MKTAKIIIGWLCFLSLVAGIFLTGAWVYLMARPIFNGAQIYSSGEPDMEVIAKEMSRTSDQDVRNMIFKKEYGRERLTTSMPMGTPLSILAATLEGGPPKRWRATSGAALLDLSGKVIAAYPRTLIGRVFPLSLHDCSFSDDMHGYADKESESEFLNAIGDRDASVGIARARRGGKVIGTIVVAGSSGQYTDKQTASYRTPEWILTPSILLRPNPADPPFRIPVLPPMAFLCFAMLLPVWAGMDAEWRGMRGVAWGILVAITGFLGLLIYLIARLPTPGVCPNCGETIHGRYQRCPNCGVTFILRCKTCGRKLKPGWQYCPTCMNAEASSWGTPSVAFEAEPETVQTARCAASKVLVTLRDSAKGMPISNARIRLSGPTCMDGITNSQGEFAAYRLSEGSYRVSAVKAGYEPASAETQVGTQGVSVALCTSVLPGRVGGRVVSLDTGSPVDDARVYIDSSRVDAEGVTSVDGRYSLGILPPGPYMLIVEADGYASASRLIDLSPGDAPPIDFELTRCSITETAER